LLGKMGCWRRVPAEVLCAHIGGAAATKEATLRSCDRM
jgi:hypothetical protein